ncbi:hypothetical protein TI39_contig4099g00030 [Zymoseptoria brevis]|uniref:Uncharacterized protein n=1 Tax=Zymoseptoria brevis TaxID=1047168 RepID=A0A0F4GE98_9PEZI|nr:hypothetical protein TI39_contig4099g00030 [Zymoseptoria brevis]
MSVASPQIVSSDQPSFDSVPDDDPPTLNAEQQHAAGTDQQPEEAAEYISEDECSADENEETDDDDDDSDDIGGSFSYERVYASQQQGQLTRPPSDAKQPPTTRSQRVPLSQVHSQDHRSPDQALGFSRVPSSANPGYMNNVITSEDQDVGAVEAEQNKSEKTQPMSTIAQADPSNNGGPSSLGQRNADRPRGNEYDLPPTPTPTVETAAASHGEVYSQHPPHKELMNTNDTADEHISQQPVPRAASAQSETQGHSVDPTELHSQQMVHHRGGAETVQNQAATRLPQLDQPNPEFDGFLSYAYGLLDRVRELEAELNEQELKWQFQAEQEKSVQESLRAQVNTFQKENDRLNTGFEQNKAKITNCESKAQKMKSFVTGLGTDIDSLKKRFNLNRLESANDARERIMKLEGLLNETSSRAQQASQTQNDAMKLCRETAAELTAANLRCRHLEEQLEAKSRLIIEEKNLREQVQSQLTSAIASHEATGRELTSSKDAVLGKLGELKIELGESTKTDEMIEMINKTFQAVQDVKSQQTPTHNDVVSSKGMLEKLAEALSGLPQQYSLGTEEMEALKAHIGNAVKDLKSDISTQERLVAQQTSDQKTIDDLRAEVRSSDARISEITSQLSTARETNTELTNQKSVLQEQVTKLESDVAASACEHEQLGNTRERLAAKETELLTTNSKADLQAQELSSLTASNADLQKQLEAIEQRLQETPAIPDFEEERSQLEQKRVKDVEHMREKMSDQAKTFHALHQSQAENTEKTLRSEREKLRGDIQRLKLELHSANKRIEDLTIEQHGQLELTKLLADSQKEVKEFRSKVANLEQANRSNAATLKDLESVQSQFTASQNELLEMTKQKDSAKEEIAALQRSSQAAKSSEEKVTKQLQQERVANRDAAQALQVELQTVKESNIRDEKLAEDAKRTAVDEEKARSKSELNIMSQRLHDAEDTIKKSAEATQNALTEQQEKYEQRIAEKVDEAAAATRERDQGMVEMKALRNKYTTAPGASQTFPSGSQGAPSADSTESGTAKKRRTLDRSQVERHRPTALQQSTAQRPDLSSRLAGPPARGPIVPESQSEFLPPSSFPKNNFPGMNAPGLQRPRGAVVEESQQSYPNSQMLRAMGPTVEQSQQLGFESQHFSQARGENLRGPVVEESQQLSFLGAVVDDVDRYASQGAAEVSTLGDPARLTSQEEADFENLFNHTETQSAQKHTQVVRTSQASRMGVSQCSQQDSRNSSTRVPQSFVLQERTSRQNQPPYISRGHAGSSLHEPETRVWKKIMAPPNSSSKRTRPSTGDSSRSGGSRSQSQNRLSNKTPEPRGSSQNGSASTHGKQGLLSSSPIFADSLKGGLTGGTQRETFGRRPSSKGRPDSSVKRKASSQVVSGHESQKKRRTSVAAKGGATSQPAPKKASQLMTTSRPSSQTGMRNTAGASSVGSRTPAPSHTRSHRNSQPTTRQTRSTKASQRTEMGAAFSQELP